jgi:hypothetical protein
LKSRFSAVQGIWGDFCPEACTAANSAAANKVIQRRWRDDSTHFKADILQNHPVSDLQAAPTGMSSPLPKKEVVPE